MLMVGIVIVQALTINIFSDHIKKLRKDIYLCKSNIQQNTNPRYATKPQYKYIEGELDLIHNGQKARLKAYFYPQKMN